MSCMTVWSGMPYLRIGQRGNMNNYGFTGTRPSIDMSEVASVKEMIFNRAKEKSSSLVSEKEEGITKDVQNDVMASARNSFSNGRIKPFGNLTQNIKTQETTSQNIVQEPVQDVVLQENLPQLKHNLQSVNNTKYTDSMRNETMLAAGNQYNRRANFTETLNFLNTQAAIRMVNGTHSKIV